jgi:serine/threonine protein kinase
MESKEGKENAYDSKDDASWTHINFKDLELGERIGGGGVGVIYSGYFGGERVALKTLFDTRVDEVLKKEYLDELLVMSKLKHSNIVSFMGACMTPPNLCFVMELCDNSLYNILHTDRHIEFTTHDAMQMAVDIGSAIEYLHAQQPCIIHRDIKSHNVLRAKNGAMKLCDFGLVNSKITQAGTPSYMAPELLENKAFNKSVDVYSFGVLLNEVFTREIPFYMIDILEIRDKVIRGDRPRLPFSCPPKMLDLIQRCWDGSDKNRPDFTEIVDIAIEVSDTMPQHSHTHGLQAGESKDALDDLLSFGK